MSNGAMTNLLYDIRETLREIRDLLKEEAQTGERIEQLANEIYASTNPIPPRPFMGGPLTTGGIHGTTSASGPLPDDMLTNSQMRGLGYREPPAPPLQADPVYGFDVNAMSGAVQAMPLPPARPAGSLPDEPDLDTVLTMGMAEPTPLVSPDRQGPPSLYPPPSLTPGVIFPQITEADVRVPGYAKRVRAVNQATKDAVYRRYGLDPANHPATEVDHYISLCLAGTNDLANLWPEPAVTPDAPGQVGFHQKDAVEAYLYHEVCQGTISLRAAQDMIRGDWYAVFLTIPHSHPALMLAMLDAPEQP